MKNIKKALVKIILFSAVAIVLYVLYSPFNKHPNNKTGSSIQFVYQQF